MLNLFIFSGYKSNFLSCFEHGKFNYLYGKYLSIYFLYFLKIKNIRGKSNHKLPIFCFGVSVHSQNRMIFLDLLEIHLSGMVFFGFIRILILMGFIMLTLIPSSVGVIFVAVIALFMGAFQAILFLGIKNEPWHKWGMVISLIVFIHSSAVFSQFYLGPTLFNRACEHIQISSFVLLILACYKFTLNFPGMGFVPHQKKIGLAGACMFFMVWWPGLAIDQEFAARKFLWLSGPYIEPPLTLVGKAILFSLGVFGLYLIAFWVHHRDKTGIEGKLFIYGFGAWFLFCLHDLICAFGFESVQYLSIYGFLIFSVSIVGITMVKHIDMVEKIDLSARALAGSKKELEIKIRQRTRDLSQGYKKLERVVDRLRQSERRNRVLSDQTEQFSLAAASMLMIENEQKFFDTVCDAIVKYSDYKRVLMSLFKPSPPFRDIIGYGGVEPEVVDRLRQVEMRTDQYDHVFEQGEKIGHQSFYIPHTMKDILKTEATVFGTGDSTGRENAWHPQDNLFVKMVNEKGEFIGVISVDESKSGLRPTHEMVRPLEIFSNLISHIIAFKREQKKTQYLEEQLMQARKMESIGTLTGGIAHDFNNILGVIIGNAELALEKLGKSDDVSSGLESIKYAGNKAADIVRQLLSFGRKSETDKRLVRVEPVLDDILRLIKATIPATMKIKTEFRPEQSVIMADPVQLNQVFLNLCLNAAQSMEEGGGTITLACDTRHLTEDSCREFPGLAPGPHIRIAVSDNGPGIPLDILDRIFDPYFTTKAVGKGSGIGLSVVHGIVKSHQGTVRVKSRPGQGTIFEVLFPLKGCEPDGMELKKLPVERGRQESILVVDDEQMVLYIMGKLLTQLGYGVTEVSDPEKALEIFRAAPEKFDLIITDMTMPGMSGMVLTRKILEIDPEKPIIICTGYNDVINGKTALDLSVSALLMKPVRMGTLAMEIQAALKKGS